ncbi:hypothetical protein D3C76_1498290 [compost metagenome]
MATSYSRVSVKFNHINKSNLVIAGNRCQIIHSSMAVFFGREHNIVPQLIHNHFADELVLVFRIFLFKLFIKFQQVLIRTLKHCIYQGQFIALFLYRYVIIPTFILDQILIQLNVQS